MKYLAEIVLPASTQSVTVKEIPSLIACAIQPKQSGRFVGYINKINQDPRDSTQQTGRPRIESLTDDDNLLMGKIWRDLPPYRDGMPESEWPQYDEAFRNSPDKPKWWLLPCWIDKALNSAILQSNAEHHHVMALHAAIRSDKLLARHPVTLLPITDAYPEAIVAVDDLRTYTTTQINVDVRVELGSPEEHAVKGVKRREKQICKIEAVADLLGYQRIAIPTGGKKKIKEECLKHRILFTDSGFDNAWKEAVNQKRLRMAAHNMFAHRD